eukprot:m.63819 g.63819  ORF g.63819 m.63819 type:complete len:633 (+) comp12487_c0_seq1:81-1979(+)
MSFIDKENAPSSGSKLQSYVNRLSAMSRAVGNMENALIQSKHTSEHGCSELASLGTMSKPGEEATRLASELAAAKRRIEDLELRCKTSEEAREAAAAREKLALSQLELTLVRETETAKAHAIAIEAIQGQREENALALAAALRQVETLQEERLCTEREREKASSLAASRAEEITRMAAAHAEKMARVEAEMDALRQAHATALADRAAELLVIKSRNMQLSSDLAEETEQYETAQCALQQAQIAREELELALESVSAQLAHSRLTSVDADEFAEARLALQASQEARAALSESVASLQSRCRTLEQQVQEHSATAATAAASLGALVASHTQLQADLVAAEEKFHAREKSREEEWNAKLDVLIGEAVARREEEIAAKTRDMVEAAERANDSLKSERDEWRVKVDLQQAEMAQMLAECQTHKATIAELTCNLESQATLLESLHAHVALQKHDITALTHKVEESHREIEEHATLRVRLEAAVEESAARLEMFEEEMAARCQELESHCATLTMELTATHEQRDAIQSQLDGTEMQLQALEHLVSTHEANEAGVRAALTAAESKCATLTTELAAARERAARIASNVQGLQETLAAAARSEEHAALLTQLAQIAAERDLCMQKAIGYANTLAMHGLEVNT